MAGWQSGYAAACKAVYSGSIPDSASNFKKFMINNCVIVSGGFDPLHIGHVRLIEAASKYGPVIVVVNSDKFLIDKKGYVFMNQEERIEIIKNIKNVHEVFLSIDHDHTVCKSIESLVNNPDYQISYFANGGDRKVISDIPETKICQTNNINLLFDIGGDKDQSSSLLVENMFDKMMLKKGNFNITKKPWGYFKSFISEQNYLLKKLVINKNEELSLQTHEYRDEHWIVVLGQILVELNGQLRPFNANDYIFIPKKSIHRIINDSKKTAIIIEIQYGNILAESDIKRIDDKYER